VKSNGVKSKVATKSKTAAKPKSAGKKPAVKAVGAKSIAPAAARPIDQWSRAAMAHHIAEKLGKAGAKPIGIEGISQGDWVLVDGNDIIIHLFRPDVRKLYSLEKMWGIDQPEPETLQAVG
jgi:hypothetical protein